MSPLNTYLASGSAISNLGQMTQPQGGIEYVPQGIPTLTTSSLLSMRQQMEESNHDIFGSYAYTTNWYCI